MAMAVRMRLAADAAATAADVALSTAAAAEARAAAAGVAARDAAAPRCHCPRGWRAEDDCSVSDDECPVGCSGHGVCQAGGVCACDVGWRGPHCATSEQLQRRAALAKLGLLGE